jgi:uncharacterized ion transporter superfamily protein YfcC
MKKLLEKSGIAKCIGAGLCIISFILWIIAAFISSDTPDMILKLVGVCTFIVGGMIISLKSENHQLVKSLLVFIIAMIIMTWLFPYGYFQGSDFVGNEVKRIGLADIGYILYYAINFMMDKIVLLFVVTGFYGVLAKTEGYQRLVSSIADKLKKNQIIATVVTSVIIYVLTSLLSQTFIIIIFIPFFVSILSKMNLDKLTVFATTFGSALVSLIGVTYGSDSLSSFNLYANLTVSTGLSYRFIIAAVVLILYNFFLVMRVKKIQKEKSSKLLIEDPFKVEDTKSKKSIIPVSIVLVLLAIITILGYVDWKSYFNITVFDNFHTWLTGLTIKDFQILGLTIKDFQIFSYILGSNAKAFGLFTYVFVMSAVLFIGSVLIAFLDNMKVDDFFSAFAEGTKRMLRPMLYLVGVFTVFGICYMVPVVPTIVKWLFALASDFNPFLTSLVAFISNALQIDFGYTGYTIAGYVTATFADNIDIAHTIFTSMYGLTQVFLPTSGLMVVGLSLMKVDYKSWFKYIWLFVVGILVILLVLFTVLTYI